jgi:hypothetical protein
MARPDAAHVLLVLLDHADPDTLLVLLKPENVLALLRHEGWSDDDVRAALTRDNKHPGELVLGLFERGRTAEELLATLGPAAVAEVAATKAGNPARAAEVAPREASAAPGSAGVSRRQTAGLVLVLAAALAPALLVLMDMKIALALLVFGTARVLCVIGLVGGLGGALAAGPARPVWIGVLGGAAASVGGFAAVVGYVLLNARMGRDTVLRLEIAAACGVGMLPGVALATLLGRSAAPRG